MSGVTVVHSHPRLCADVSGRSLVSWPNQVSRKAVNSVLE